MNTNFLRVGLLVLNTALVKKKNYTQEQGHAGIINH